MAIGRRHRARDRPTREIDRPMERIKPFDVRPDDFGAGSGEPQVHRRSARAERIARATCRLDCRSTWGSDGAGDWIAIATRTSLLAEPTCSIRPLLDGTK